MVPPGVGNYLARVIGYTSAKTTVISDRGAVLLFQVSVAAARRRAWARSSDTMTFVTNLAFIVMLLGYFFEIFGLGLAALGLLLTWKQHAADREMGPALLAALAGWMRRSPTTPSKSEQVVLIGTAYETDTAMPITPRGGEPPTFDEVIAAAAITPREALEMLKDSQRGVRELSADFSDLEAAIESTKQGTDDLTRDTAVGGIPLAVCGLVAVLIGFCLQGIASVATFPSVP